MDIRGISGDTEVTVLRPESRRKSRAVSSFEERGRFS